MTADRRRLAVRWTALFALNLPVPLVFASAVVSAPAAWAGVAAGLAPAWAVGMAATWVGPRSRAAAWVGASVVAATQFLPFAQLAAGALAADLCERAGLTEPLWGDKPSPAVTPVAALAMTVLTSIPLLALATLIGGAWLAAKALLTTPRSGYQGYEPPADTDE